MDLKLKKRRINFLAKFSHVFLFLVCSSGSSGSSSGSSSGEAKTYRTIALGYVTHNLRLLPTRSQITLLPLTRASGCCCQRSTDRPVDRPIDRPIEQLRTLTQPLTLAVTQKIVNACLIGHNSVCSFQPSTSTRMNWKKVRKKWPSHFPLLTKSAIACLLLLHSVPFAHAQDHHQHHHHRLPEFPRHDDDDGGFFDGFRDFVSDPMDDFPATRNMFYGAMNRTSGVVLNQVSPAGPGVSTIISCSQRAVSRSSSGISQQQ